MNNIEYDKEVRDTATNIIDEARDQLADSDYTDIEELINDYLLHETIDSHQWVIYYSYNLDVIQNSDNADYYIDNFGAESLESSLKQGGLNALHCHIAFWALYADVQEEISNQIEQQAAA